MRPHFFARMAGSAACMQRNTDLRFTAIVVSKSASVSVSTLRVSATPALLIRMSTGPSSAAARSNIVVTASPCDTSACTAIARPPASRMAFTSAFAAPACSR